MKTRIEQLKKMMAKSVIHNDADKLIHQNEILKYLRSVKK